MTIVFFDMDETLIGVNSATLWVQVPVRIFPWWSWGEVDESNVENLAKPWWQVYVIVSIFTKADA